MAKAAGAKATGAGRSYTSRIIVILALLAIVGLAAALWFNRSTVQGYAAVSTSYYARIACSCRFVAGRSLDDCTKDALAGMEMVSLSDDPGAQSVTASIPFVDSSTATNREGYGCVMESWEG